MQACAGRWGAVRGGGEQCEAVGSSAGAIGQRRTAQDSKGQCGPVQGSAGRCRAVQGSAGQ